MNDAFEVSTVVSFAFWVVSAITIAAAIMVVTVKDVFKAAVFLAGTFIGVSAIFFLLNAEFVGWGLFRRMDNPIPLCGRLAWRISRLLRFTSDDE